MTVDLQGRFNELRRELFKEIDVINVRLQNIEDSLQAQRSQRANRGVEASSPRLAATNGYGSANLTGFADTVKVTFSNNRPEADTEAAKSKGKPKRTKRKRRGAEPGDENDEDSEIADIHNYFMLPAKESGKTNNRRGGREHADAKPDKNQVGEEGRDPLDKEESFRRSLREL